MILTGGLSLSQDGKNLSEILSLKSDNNIPLFKSIEDAIENLEFDILVDFTKPEIAKHNIHTALKKAKSHCRNFRTK